MCQTQGKAVAWPAQREALQPKVTLHALRVLMDGSRRTLQQHARRVPLALTELVEPKRVLLQQVAMPIKPYPPKQTPQ